MRKIGRVVCIVFASAAIFFGLLPPLLYRVLNMGVVFTLLFGVLLLGVTLLWDSFTGWGRISRRLHEVSDRRKPYVPRWWRRLRTLLCAGLAAAFAFGAGLSVPMARAAWFNPPEGARTVIILGCRVMNGRPSLMMRYRLDAALAYLTAHPDAPVICAGGLDDHETVTEAAVMRESLLAAGISPGRIYLEDQSRSTAQNIGFSARIIAENGLPPALAVASDGFHQLRAAVYARRNGLTAGALPAVTPWGLFPSYWVREWFALVKSILI